MQAVIIAAGEGKRLRPLTRNRPKALLPVANNPIIDYPIQALSASGVRDIIVVVGYRKDHVIRYLDRLDIPVQIVEQKKQLGTANALSCAEPLIKEDFLVVPGDNYINPGSIAKILNKKNAVLVKEHPYPSNFGVVLMKGGEVSCIIEKPERAPSFTVSTGIFSLPRDFLSQLTSTDLTDAINEMIKQGGHLSAVTADDWQDAVYPWDLLALNVKTLSMIIPEKSGIITSDARISGAVRIGKGSSIGPFTTITGPVVIGENAVIGSHCCIGPHVSIGARVKIEPFTMLQNALLMNDAMIGSHSQVTEAVIGEGSALGDHTTIAPGVPMLEIEDTLIQGRFGCVLGDQVRSDPFCIYQGAIVGNGSRIRGGKMISGLEAFQDGVLVV
ncbi:MAG: Bifunctional protein GlmU [Euryarchaeota archaeon ADurb.BinA087]|nr:NTP transferase domain-containing protein [Methanoregulaceae archaeon]OPZ43240.1 MAG: Bifunctional protein GlmU [Euryarchaeota archaeon ADurb.BinA087]HPX72852.1 sugar phosphate nucleotidyltransferase [Methanoregulaceae archaeon]HQA80014.1 sugar phosphate nucleotidyltransferase [Methanoregulaceae archaeon]